MITQFPDLSETINSTKQYFSSDQLQMTKKLRQQHINMDQTKVLSCSSFWVCVFETSILV